MKHCDGCNKSVRSVKACGRDANGDPDAPDLCFLCEREAYRGRAWVATDGRYRHHRDIEQDALDREAAGDLAAWEAERASYDREMRDE